MRLIPVQRCRATAFADAGLAGALRPCGSSRLCLRWTSRRRSCRSRFDAEPAGCSACSISRRRPATRKGDRAGSCRGMKAWVTVHEEHWPALLMPTAAWDSHGILRRDEDATVCRLDAFGDGDVAMDARQGRTECGGWGPSGGCAARSVWLHAQGALRFLRGGDRRCAATVRTPGRSVCSYRFPKRSSVSRPSIVRSVPRTSGA